VPQYDWLTWIKNHGHPKMIEIGLGEFANGLALSVVELKKGHDHDFLMEWQWNPEHSSNPFWVVVGHMRFTVFRLKISSEQEWCRQHHCGWFTLGPLRPGGSW
jgi:hypothetical protein